MNNRSHVAGGSARENSGVPSVWPRTWLGEACPSREKPLYTKTWWKMEFVVLPST